MFDNHITTDDGDTSREILPVEKINPSEVRTDSRRASQNGPQGDVAA